MAYPVCTSQIQPGAFSTADEWRMKIVYIPARALPTIVVRVTISSRILRALLRISLASGFLRSGIHCGD
jgi:hypothetical protein